MERVPGEATRPGAPAGRSRRRGWAGDPPFRPSRREPRERLGPEERVEVPPKAIADVLLRLIDWQVGAYRNVMRHERGERICTLGGERHRVGRAAWPISDRAPDA